MRSLKWIGSSHKDLIEFPLEVRQEMGYALYVAQMGGIYMNAKPFKGCGTGVYEIVSDYDRNTYRSVYIVNIANAVYVLHAFQKEIESRHQNSARGNENHQESFKTIKSRSEVTNMTKPNNPIKPIEIMESSGNVFKDLNLPNAEEYLAKAELARKINILIDDLGLKKQADAAKRLGIDQPKISAIRRGQLTAFSLERLISYLNKLDQDVEIVIKAKPLPRKGHGHLQVAFG